MPQKWKRGQFYLVLPHFAPPSGLPSNVLLPHIVLVKTLIQIKFMKLLAKNEHSSMCIDWSQSLAAYIEGEIWRKFEVERELLIVKCKTTPRINLPICRRQNLEFCQLFVRYGAFPSTRSTDDDVSALFPRTENISPSRRNGSSSIAQQVSVRPAQMCGLKIDEFIASTSPLMYN